MDRDGSFAPLRFGRVHLVRRFKCVRHLDTEIAQSRRARLRRVMVEEDVVAFSPQPWLAANELPDLAQGRPLRRANRARRDLAPHRGQLAGVGGLYVDGDGHSSIVNQNRDRVPVTRTSPNQHSLVLLSFTASRSQRTERSIQDYKR